MFVYWMRLSISFALLVWGSIVLYGWEQALVLVGLGGLISFLSKEKERNGQWSSHLLGAAMVCASIYTIQNGLNDGLFIALMLCAGSHVSAISFITTKKKGPMVAFLAIAALIIYMIQSGWLNADFAFGISGAIALGWSMAHKGNFKVILTFLLLGFFILSCFPINPMLALMLSGAFCWAPAFLQKGSI